jgi:hypothetical protein
MIADRTLASAPRPRARHRALAAVALLGALASGAACRDRDRARGDQAPRAAAVAVASRPADAVADPWPELAGLPRARPVRSIELPVRRDVPRFEVHGPLISAGVAILASSQFGFLGVDWQRGEVLWSKPAGRHVAPPLVLPGGDLALLGDCATPPPTELPVLACLRVVTSGGADRSYGAVHGAAELAADLAGGGPMRTWLIDDERVAWQRGEHVVTVTLASGVATRGAPPPPPLRVRYRDRALEILLEDDGLRARSLERGRPAWRAPGRFAALLGVVPGLPYETPMLRVVRSSTARSGGPPSAFAYFDVLDIDALTAAGGQAATPAPGLQLLGTTALPGGTAALAIRLDTSLRRDYVVAYTSSARLAWTYPLPVQLRTDPVGVGIADDAVLVFHDGDTLTVLPPIE